MSQYEDRMKPFKTGDRCDIAQYEMLSRCSEKKDITKWNEWREENQLEEIWLSGADFQKSYLEGADLQGAHLEGAKLWKAHMKGAILSGAHLEGAKLWKAHMEGAHLCGIHLEGANLYKAHLEKDADLKQCADFSYAHLEGADLQDTHLEDANLWRAHLEGADLLQTHLEGADFKGAVVNSDTQIWDCEIDKKTDFTGVGLDAARVEPGLKQLLEYNVRRFGWEKWYKQHRLLTPLVWFFWWMSDYGRSTVQIARVFLGLALAFAAVYYRWPHFLTVNDSHLHGFLHAFYFSVVTMTTLGFGDIHANPASPLGQVLLMVQVILGYILLAALVTRFAVLFTAGGPAGKFAKKKKKTGSKQERRKSG